MFVCVNARNWSYQQWIDRWIDGVFVCKYGVRRKGKSIPSTSLLSVGIIIEVK
jgi:hypothetical protein